MGAVFISYRRGDTEGPGQTPGEQPEELLGKESAFMDVDSIALGRDFREVLQDRLGSCDMMLALIGPGWLDAKDAAGNRRWRARMISCARKSAPHSNGIFPLRRYS